MRPDWKFKLFVIVPIIMAGGLAAGLFFSPSNPPMAVRSSGDTTTFTCEEPPCRLTQDDIHRAMRAMHDNETRCFEADQSKCKFGPVSIYEGGENDHPGPSDSALCVIDRGVVAARPGAICRIIINEDSLMPNSFECFNGDPRCK